MSFGAFGVIVDEMPGRTHTPKVPVRLSLLLGLALVTCGAVAPGAFANATVTRLGPVISATVREVPGAAGDGNHGLVVDNILQADVRFGQMAFGDPEITSNTCRANPLANDVVCPAAVLEITQYELRMGDGADRVLVRENRDQNPCAATLPSWTIFGTLGNGRDTFDTAAVGERRDCQGSAPSFIYRLELAGGGGNDDIDAALAQSAKLSGNTGDDELNGSASIDELNGEQDDDVLNGRLSADTLTGGSGDDELSGAPGDDTVKGGSGKDALFGGLGRDTLQGGGGPDRILGGPDAVKDTIEGEAGDDDLEGGEGGDEITGGADNDELKGEGGSDTIRSGDGEVDTIDCGSGFFDTASVDLKDVSVRNCEFVTRKAIDDGAPGRPLGRRLRIRRNGSATVRISCPRSARVRCRGRVTVRLPKRRRKLASASYAVRLGKRKAVTVRLSAAERSLLLRRRRALVTTLEKGRSRLGPRSAERTMRTRR